MRNVSHNFYDTNEKIYKMFAEGWTSYSATQMKMST